MSPDDHFARHSDLKTPHQLHYHSMAYKPGRHTDIATTRIALRLRMNISDRKGFDEISRLELQARYRQDRAPSQRGTTPIVEL